METLTINDIGAASRGRPDGLERPGRASYGLSTLLVLVAAVASAMTILAPDVLRGVAVMNGSARGTALVVLVVAVPVVALSMAWAARGSTRAQVVWLGGLGYLIYNSVCFCSSLRSTSYSGRVQRSDRAGEPAAG